MYTNNLWFNVCFYQKLILIYLQELEQVKGELEKEKMKMQKMALDLQEEYNKLKL